MTPPIKGFIPHSLLDWEGKISAIVFLAGCNFRCGYCHAGHLVLGEPGLERIPLPSILDNLQQKQGWIDGVVVSGGEPTLYEGLEELIDIFGRLGLAVRLDTNGSNPKLLEQLIERGKIQYVAMDVKAPLTERYHEVAARSVDLDAISRSIDLLLGSPIDYEFRTTVCHGVPDEVDIREMSRRLSGARRWILQGFRPLGCIDPSYRELPAVTEKRLSELAHVAREAVASVSVRGV